MDREKSLLTRIAVFSANSTAEPPTFAKLLTQPVMEYVRIVVEIIHKIKHGYILFDTDET